jgi:hypothetical protein
VIALRGMSWNLFHRNRVGLVIALAHLCTFCGMLLIADVNQVPPFLLAISTLLIVGSYLFLVGIFIFQDADVGSERSAFPPYFFTLPVRTGQLVVVPMALGTVTTFSLIFLVSLVARHAGTNMGLWWPATAGAAVLALLQAVFWFPFGIPYSKLVLTLLLLPAICMGIGVGFFEDISEATICAALAVLTGLSYFVAHLGVVKARRGDGREISLRRTDSKSSAVQAKKAFSSPAQAQSWYEWKQHGKVLPFIAGMLVIVLCMPLAWDNTLSPITGFTPDAKGMVPTVPTFLTVYYPILLGMLPWVAWVIGSGARRSDTKRSDRTFHLFYGTRPMADHTMVGLKFRTGLKSALVAWAVVFLMSLPLLLLKGGYQVPNASYFGGGGDVVLQLNEPIFVVLAKFFTLDAALRCAGFMLLILAFTWRNYVVGFWTELSGKGWLRHGYPMFWGVLIMSFILVGSSAPTGSLPAMGPRAIAGIIWGLVGLKVIVVFLLLARQIKSGTWNLGMMIAKPAAIWLLGTAPIVAVGLFLAEPYIAAGVANEVWTRPVAVWAIVGSGIVWAPAARMMLAPMMLSLNRHRMN